METEKKIIDRLKRNHQISDVEYEQLKHCIKYNSILKQAINDKIHDYEESITELGRLYESEAVKISVRQQLEIVIDDLKSMSEELLGKE